MANNGYLVDSVCTGDVQAKFVLSCPSGTYIFYNGYVLPSSVGSGTCYSKNVSTGALTALKTVSVPAFDCEIPGPPLTETQQIEAINALFPSAIAILAIAWGFKYIRVLVAEWLKERNASD